MLYLSALNGSGTIILFTVNYVVSPSQNIELLMRNFVTNASAMSVRSVIVKYIICLIKKSCGRQVKRKKKPRREQRRAKGRRERRNVKKRTRLSSKKQNQQRLQQP